MNVNDSLTSKSITKSVKYFLWLTLNINNLNFKILILNICISIISTLNIWNETVTFKVKFIFICINKINFINLDEFKIT